MAEQFNSEEFIKEYREQLAQVDEIAQMVLKGHLEVEADLDDALGAIFERKDFLKQSRLSFVQKAKLARAYVEHEDEKFGWALIFGFNALRNEIAHGKKSDRRSAKVNELRRLLQGFGTEAFDRFIKTASEADVVVHAAALCSGFVVGIENEIKGQKAAR